MKTIYCIGSTVLDINAGGMPGYEKWKEKQRIDHILFQAGGDALNQASHLARLGYRAVLSSAVGSDREGEMLLRVAAERRIDPCGVGVRDDIGTGVSLVLVGEEGERHTFSTGGAYGAFSGEDLLPLTEACPDAVSIASFFQMPALEDGGLEAYLWRAKEMGIPVFADLGSDKRKQGMRGVRRFLPYLHTFLPSEEDALQMTEGMADGSSEVLREKREGSPEVLREKRVERCATALRREGAERVVIKCGAMGCYYLSEEEAGWVRAPEVVPVDTTGAGDCFVAYYVAGVLEGLGMRSACEAAVRAATESTLRRGPF